MEEEETKRYAKGFRFDPFDVELITDYLKPMIMGKQLPCNLIKFRQVYGPTSNPWHVFPNDDQSWLFSPHLKDTEKCMFVFSKLSKLSRSTALKKTGSKKAGCVTSENTSKKAGFGTWDGKTTRKQIRDGKGNVVGERRYLVFEINEIDSGVSGFDWRKVGLFRMHEYSLSGINAGLDSAHSIVLCKITYDSSKACPINLKPGNNKACSINLKSGNINIAGNVIKSSGEAHEKDDVGPSFDDQADLDDEGPCFDVDWIMRTLECDEQEGPVEDNSISNLGKRKFEAEENSCRNKKTCL